MRFPISAAAILVILTDYLFAQNNAIFYGGSDDGYSQSCYQQGNNVIESTIFKGGTDDGYSNNCYQQTNSITGGLFTGGSQDGYDYTCYAQATSPTSGRFFYGGTADGYAVLCYQQGNNENQSSIFRGSLSAGYNMACTGHTALPVELLEFTAIAVNNQYAKLDWTTASEINNDHFTIEKTKDGIGYEIVTVVKGAGNSTTILHYTYNDQKPYKGISYYRLKQTDFNGAYDYSALEAVNFSDYSHFDFNVYPNPSDGNELKIALFTNKTSEITIIISDMLGKELYTRVIDTERNYFETTLFSNGYLLAKGIYNITASGKGILLNKKVIIY